MISRDVQKSVCGLSGSGGLSVLYSCVMSQFFMLDFTV